ncbi:hypothetical protein [uncultured Sulfitobacter sp.]|uniref:hypothetical protein n=1 Tax=uncultured Sulfitobacter sp. TaxID=191468 RepID=UPI002631C0C5|nr:hypothetical protein [uncultured Sulfitobacter sp.]
MTRFSPSFTFLGSVAIAALIGLAPIAHASDAPNTNAKAIPQDPDATIDKALPADEMVGDEAPTGTTFDVDPDSATVDGTPRTAEKAYVNTQSEEAEVGIPNSE